MAGRPSDIDSVIGTHPETGQPITVADRIIASLRAGLFLEPAIQAAGLRKQTAYNWLHTAGKVRLEHRGDLTDATLTDHERACVVFLDAVDEASGIWEVDSNTILERLSRGGIPQVTVTEKHDAKGVLLERTTRTTNSLPDARVIEWRLTRRYPDRYSDRIEITGAGGGPLEITREERARSLLKQIQRAKIGKRKPPKAKDDPPAAVAR